MSWLTTTDVKEELSVAYLHAIAAHHRLYVEVIGKDRDSVDALVHSRGMLCDQSVLRSVKLGVQLKARAGLDISGKSFPCVLPLKNYDDLRDPDHHIPNILVVLVLPRADQDRLSWSVDELALRQCAYWRSLVGEPEVQRDARVANPTVTVRVPTANALSPDALLDVMVRVSCQQELHDGA